MKNILLVILLFAVSMAQAQQYELERTFMGHKSPVSYVTFRSEDNLLVSGDESGKIIFWNALTGEIVNHLDIHTAKVTHLEFSNKGRLLASASYDGTVKVYDLKKRKLRQIFNNSTTEAYQDVKGNEPTFCTFSPDDKHVYFGGYNLQILKGSVRRGKTEGVYRNPEFGITCGKISPTKNHLVFAAGGSVYFMSLKTNKITRELYKSDIYDDYVCEIAFMPRSNRLATWAVNGQMHFWEWRTNQLAYSLAATPQEGTSDVAFSEDGKLLVTGNFGGKTKLWNTENNKILQLLGEHTAEVVTFAFSKDAEYIVTGSQDNTVRLWKKPDEEKPLVKNMPKKTRKRKVEVQRTVKVTNRYVEIHLWDNFQIDGDTISVNLNGNWIVNNYKLDGKPRILKVELAPKDNYMIVHAHNLGSIPPNTIAVAIKDGNREQVFTLKSTMGTSAAIYIKREE
jgi:WD40 repeat protein